MSWKRRRIASCTASLFSSSSSSPSACIAAICFLYFLVPFLCGLFPSSIGTSASLASHSASASAWHSSLYFSSEHLVTRTVFCSLSTSAVYLIVVGLSPLNWFTAGILISPSNSSGSNPSLYIVDSLSPVPSQESHSSYSILPSSSSEPSFSPDPPQDSQSTISQSSSYLPGP